MFQKRKAFMHSIEGVIAAILLLSFFVSIDFSTTRTEWEGAKSASQARDLLDVVVGTNLRELVLQDRGDDLKGILRYFTSSPTARIIVKTGGIPKKDIFAGLVMDDTDRFERPSAIIACPPEVSAALCASGTVEGSTGFLIAADSITSGFDRIYVDFDKNGVYTKNEGPIGAGSLFFASESPYIVKSIYYDGSRAAFWRAAKYIDYFYTSRISDINSRSVRIVFSATDLSETTDYYGKFDVLLIPEYRDLSSKAGKLSEILGKGVPIVEVADIPMPLDVVQSTVFGLTGANYGVLSSSANVTLNRNILIKDTTYALGMYAFFSEITYSNLTSDLTGYTVPLGIAAGRIGTVGLDSKNISFLLAAAPTPSSYTSVYFDLDGDKSFRDYPDNLSYSVGQEAVLDEDSYTIEDIGAAGAHLRISLKESQVFTGSSDPPKIYAKDGSYKSVPFHYEDKTYRLGTKSIGEETEFTTEPGFFSQTLPFGQHRNGTLDIGGGNTYSVVLTNATGNYTLWNIDIDKDGAYNGRGEGPFYTKETAQIGPEAYRVFVSADGSKATARLEERWHVPYMVTTQKGDLSKTVWIQDGLKGAQFESLLQGAILWASAKEHYVVSAYTGGGSDVVSAKKTIVLNRDFIEVGEVEFMVVS